MTDTSPALRTSPRLWVERLWIIDSLDTVKPIREICFSRGLNLIASEPGDGNTGHGVGKTALCQLLRCVLEDPQWAAGTPLRDELLHSFPTGAVAARVHVDGEAWTVLKPWQHQRRYRASRDADWQSLARDETANDYDAYVETLKRKLVNILPVRQLPGSGQTIQWQHILAWCSRDQECRYRGYYHWRTEGTGFSLPAQSPMTLVKVLLGLLDDVSVQSRLKQLETEIGKLEDSIGDLKRRPADLVEHVRHQLAVALEQPDNSPFRSTGLFDEKSLVGVARQRIEAYGAEITTLQDQQAKIQTDYEEAIAERAPVLTHLNTINNRIRQIEAAIVGNAEEVERLRQESSALQGRFHLRCEDGNRLVGECQYVKDRVASISLDSVRDAKLREQQVGGWRNELSQLSASKQQLEQSIRPLRDRVKRASSALGENQQRQLSTLAAQQRLKEAIADYETYEAIAEGRSEWQPIKALEGELRAKSAEQQRLELDLKTQKAGFRERKQAIESSLVSFARQLPGFTWGALCENDPRPFRIGPSHSTALAVLETLLGDFTCLYDSIDPKSFHPGFLLHDSPREAEMSEPVFWKFLALAAARQEAIQYIVTTSTNVPDDFHQHVRLELSNRGPDAMLFRARLGVEQEALDA